MTDRETLRALLERVKAATGPDRTIDRDIAEHIVGTRFRSTKRGREWLEDSHGGVETWSRQAAPVTASIDATLALVERALPGHDWMVDKSAMGFYCAFWTTRSMKAIANAQAPTASIAILATLLTALIEKGPDA